MDQLDALRGVDSLQVVLHRFSDGVEVVKCVLEFCKEVGDVEQNYSNSIQKLLRSSSYSFHSNILMKWLGSDPYQEIGTVRHSWQKLGAELSKLADLHSQKASAYLEAVRKPLQELLPQLEETRQELKGKVQTLKATLEAASQYHSKEKQKYVQLGDSCQKLKDKSDAKAKQKLLVMEGELKLQETIYRDAHGKLLDAHMQFDEDVKNLYQKVQEKEIGRVNTLKTSLQQFTRTMSNTAPAYLEGFQRIVISVDEISGPGDIKHFVSDHKDLTVSPEVPAFERHPYMTGEAVTQFTDTSTSSLGASASNAAKKLLSRLNFRESKSSPPREDSETSVEGDPQTNTASPVNANEESVPAITKESSEVAKSLDTGDSNISNSESGTTATKSAQSSNLKSGTSAQNSKSAQEKAQDSDMLGTMSKSTKQLSEQSQSSVPPKETVRAKKPAVKVRPQQIVTAASTPSPQESSSRGGEKAKRELGGSSETSTSTNASSSSSLPSSSASHVSNVIQRMQNSQTSQQHQQHHQQQQQPSANVTRRAPKPAVTARPGPGPTYPHENIPGPIKPRPVRKTAPTSHSPRAPRPLSVPNMDDNSSLSLLTSSLPRLTECSKEELELLSELYQKAAGNDYYGLLGVDSDATMEELARARREKTRVLHPDHFANDPERQAKAQEQLALINQVFQDVLKSEETRRHYDQLCRFRQFYVKVVQQKLPALETALGKLVRLHKEMKKAQMPLALLDELLLVQKLIRTRIKLLSATS